MADANPVPLLSLRLPDMSDIVRNDETNGPGPSRSTQARRKPYKRQGPRSNVAPQRQTVNHFKRHDGINHNNTRPWRNDKERNVPAQTQNIKTERPKFVLSYRTLSDVANSDPGDIINRLNAVRNGFSAMLESKIEKDDIFVLIIKILASVSKSSFEQLKIEILLEVCNGKFIESFQNYLMHLPFTMTKAKNSLYWNNQLDFWSNFIEFCDCIILSVPSVAIKNCRPLIEFATPSCVECLNKKHNFALPQEHMEKLEEFKNKMNSIEEAHKKGLINRKAFELQSEEPPDDFRSLSLLPNQFDFTEKRQFLRPNIVEGSYKDVEHYLDVQFRLLREDCIRPLREGILQFMKNPTKRKYDNIRVYRNVRIIEPYISKKNFGYVLQLDEKTTKLFQNIKWSHSKKLLYGSLMVLTKNNCETFIIATILERNEKFLKEGKIPIDVMNEKNALFNDSFVLIESEVYFEPYYHVMKVLQNPRFADQLAMRNYIVKVEITSNSPAYIDESTQYEICLSREKKLRFNVLEENSWPTCDELGLNQSQYEAYRLALTHEFSVIQGPPGTGKTFLGVKIAETLLHNLCEPHPYPRIGINPEVDIDAEDVLLGHSSSKITSFKGSCILLVLCYTNHALDQFLEEIMKLTPNIVRVGGQSRNENLNAINISKKRYCTSDPLTKNKMYKLKCVIRKLEGILESVDQMKNGVVTYNYLKMHSPECRPLKNFRGHDPLFSWLFDARSVNYENILIDDIDFEDIYEHIHVENIQNKDDVEDIHHRNQVDIDEDDDDEERDGLSGFNMAFSLEEEFKKLSKLTRQRNAYMDKYGIDDLITNNKIEGIKFNIRLFKTMSKYRNKKPAIKIHPGINFSRVPLVERWSLYFKWTNDLVKKIKENIEMQQEDVRCANTAYEEARMMLDLQLLRQTEVVGMTTSGAARLHKLLQELAPPIVIVEEAAEVFEQHIVTSITKSCQHLILIGDHLQLRPSAAHIDLARRFNIEVSLFERMIKNKIHSRCLSVQHRMRPEIAALVAHIYPELENHPSVKTFPDVLGMTNNLFFFTHDYQEEVDEEQTIKKNTREADMVLALANYLMQQDYNPEDVTLLAAYSGQMFYMRSQRNKYPYLTNNKITVVDNYQGEESKIILLSLVRNNAAKKIGFLGTENRICVALSRARQGMYIFGNIAMLKENSELWCKVADTLEKNNSLGRDLKLKCEIHQSDTTIKCSKDFEKVPEGGCMEKCTWSLPCGHPCTLLCHGYDRGHHKIKCLKKCERILCELGHVCPLNCFMECEPCKVKLEKELPCGHKSLIYCHLDPFDPKIKCFEKITVTLPACKHEAEKMCFMNIDSLKCEVKCEFRVDSCGHQCLRKCHATDDPHHIKYVCNKPCPRNNKGCTAGIIEESSAHSCAKLCHEQCDECRVKVNKKRNNCRHSELVMCSEDVNDKPCIKNCGRMLPCQHFCKKKCFEQCGDCKQKVKKTVPECGHEAQVMCASEVTRKDCTSKCERVMACGHKCKMDCKEECDITQCAELIEHDLKLLCGHKSRLPCGIYTSVLKEGDSEKRNELLLMNCLEKCNMTLQCGHACAGTCSRCHQGRLHIACQSPCNKINVCGHECKEPCNLLCPPCKMPCEVKCPHSKCRNICGVPCTPCKEQCFRKCIHRTCKAKCSDPCRCKPWCDEPCNIKMNCGHDCHGLCGEPCPNICKICQPDSFPRDFLGYEFDDDARFVRLEDCKHILEVEDFHNLMTGDKETIFIRQCPLCRKPIINTPRFKDTINRMLKNEINPVKSKVFGEKKIIDEEADRLKNKLFETKNNHITLHEENGSWKKAYLKIGKSLICDSRKSLLQLGAYSIHIDILDMMGSYHREYLKISKRDILNHFFTKYVTDICNLLCENSKKISQQQQMDIKNELNRIHAIIQLSKIISLPSYMSARTQPKVKDAFIAALKIILSCFIFQNNKALDALKILEKEIKVSGVVTQEERSLIVKAMGFKAGHWFKCPNGHIYCIGDCGGAMVTAKCPECGAAIGGSHHRLLADNSLAREMDGARYPAWSEQNNMANFIL